MLDIETFSSAFQEASPRLLAIALAMCRSRQTAQDLVQEAGLIAWRKRESFTEGTDFAAWTGQIVRNLSLRHNRDTRRRHMLPLEESLSPEKPDGNDGSYAKHMGTGELISGNSIDRESIGDLLGIDDNLAEALVGLSESARMCFLLRTLGQLSYEEIAKTLDIAPGTAMSHVHRSRKRILLQLSQDENTSHSSNDREGEP